MEPIRFVFCIHNHQPVGNFDHVIEAAYQDAYRPFLEVMERHPAFPWVLHNSGCLWEWLEGHHEEYIDRVGRMVAEGRLELLGGGFFEPVLPALAPDDRHGQIVRMAEYLERRFGVRPRGIWLAERVWEPELPLDLAEAGVTYLPLDDTQLHQVGVRPEDVRGSFVTESGGRMLRIFPALMALRYRIPYADPSEVVRFLRDPFPGGGDGLAIYADDGEKFGVWPGSHKLLYEEHWLERFLQGVEQSADRIKVTTFAKEIEQKAQGLVYLPAGSYAEMGQWSLPPEGQESYERVRQALAAAGLASESERFVRGGFWRNFFARYPESHWMHMRSLDASRRCDTLRNRIDAGVWNRARDHLWRAQCNCAYWHGVFGGLYLPHLRHGIYAELIRGEAELARAVRGGDPWVAVREHDLDLDGTAELALENESVVLWVAPDRGGCLVEWDDRAAAMNVVNGMTRRPEFYHREVGDASRAPDARAETIHTQIRAREEGLRELLSYDDHPRACWVDRIFAERPHLRDLRSGAAEDIGNFAQRDYRASSAASDCEVAVRLEAEGAVRIRGASVPLRIEKTIVLAAGQRGFHVRWRYRNLSGDRVQVWAGIENLINLLAANNPDRYVLVDGQVPAEPHLGGVAEARGIESIALVEAWRNWHLWLQASRPVDLYRYPVETVSLSEAGAERNFQGTALLLAMPLDLEPGAVAVLDLSAALRSGVPERSRRVLATPGGAR